jgi:hypothetical protein
LLPFTIVDGLVCAISPGTVRELRGVIKRHLGTSQAAEGAVSWQ